MPPCNDGLDPILQEQTDILKRQLARGNNGSVKTKYITYTIEADNLKAARARLSSERRAAVDWPAVPSPG